MPREEENLTPRLYDGAIDLGYYDPDTDPDLDDPEDSEELADRLQGYNIAAYGSHLLSLLGVNPEDDDFDPTEVEDNDGETDSTHDHGEPVGARTR